MKMPRWLVVSLLSVSVLAVLGYGTWWWVTWPERTARKFVELVNCEDFDSANSMLAYPRNTQGPHLVKDGDLLGVDEVGFHTATNRKGFVQAFHDKKVRSRSFRDMLEGRLNFDVVVFPALTDHPLIVAEVKRGTIALQLDRRGTSIQVYSGPGGFGLMQP